MTEDSFVGYGDDSLSLNLYTYCYNNPVNLTDPTGFDSYILYDATAKSGDKKHTFKDEADIRAKQLKDTYGTKVWVIAVSNAKEFETKWDSQVGYGAFGNSVTVDEVVIIAHGSAQEKNSAGFGYIYFESDGSRLVSTKDAISNSDTDVLISNLKSKTVGSLYFSSCNSGNPDIQNTATAFKNRMTIKNSITAWDGGTIFNYNTGKLEAGAYGGWFKEKFRQHTYYKFVDKTWYGKPKRKREGQVIITPTIIPEFGGSHFKAF